MCFGSGIYSDIGDDLSTDMWLSWWHQIASKRLCQYDLLSGRVAEDFVNMLADEVNELVSGNMKSERLIVFCSVILQRDQAIKKGADIRCLLNHRLDEWRQGMFKELVHELIRCVNHLKRPRFDNTSDNHTLKIFSQLM